MSVHEPVPVRHDPPRSVRVDEELWWAAKTMAADRDETVSAVVRKALRRYIANPTEPVGDPHPMTPAAEHVLQVGLARALGMVRAGQLDDAVRALTVAQDAANLIDVAERARIVGTEAPR